MSRYRALAALVGLVVAVPGAVVLAAPASAHSQLVSSDPANGSTVAVAPTSITLTFDEPLQASGHQVLVTAPDGSVVSSGAPTVSGVTLVQPLLPMRATGTYRLSARIVSEDGDAGDVTMSFDLGPPDAAVTASASAAGSASSMLPIAIVSAIALLALLAGLVLASRRGRRQHPTRPQDVDQRSSAPVDAP